MGRGRHIQVQLLGQGLVVLLALQTRQKQQLTYSQTDGSLECTAAAAVNTAGKVRAKAQ